MVRLGSTVERGQEVGGVFPHVQLVNVAPRAGPHPDDQLVVFQPSFLASIEVEIAGFDHARGPVRRSASSSAL